MGKIPPSPRRLQCYDGTKASPEAEGVGLHSAYTWKQVGIQTLEMSHTVMCFNVSPSSHLYC